jgi:hypothetical protein
VPIVKTVPESFAVLGAGVVVAIEESDRNKEHKHDTRKCENHGEERQRLNMGNLGGLCN